MEGSNNTTVVTHGMSAIEIVEVVYLSQIAFLTIFGNCMVILAFVRGPRTIRSYTNYFVVSLATTDLMVGCFSLPFWIVFRAGKLFIISFIDLVICSVYNLVSILIDSCMLDVSTPLYGSQYTSVCTLLYGSQYTSVCTLLYGSQYTSVCTLLYGSQYTSVCTLLYGSQYTSVCTLLYGSQYTSVCTLLYGSEYTSVCTVLYGSQYTSVVQLSTSNQKCLEILSS